MNKTTSLLKHVTEETDQCRNEHSSCIHQCLWMQFTELWSTFFVVWCTDIFAYLGCKQNCGIACGFEEN